MKYSCLDFRQVTRIRRHRCETFNICGRLRCVWISRNFHTCILIDGKMDMGEDVSETLPLLLLLYKSVQRGTVEWHAKRERVNCLMNPDMIRSGYHRDAEIALRLASTVYMFMCGAVCCNVWQCVAVCCSGSPWVAMGCRGLPWVEVCCNALQCVTLCCSAFSFALFASKTRVKESKHYPRLFPWLIEQHKSQAASLTS